MRHTCPCHRRAFTLVELLVVLLVLAILATVALEATEGIAEQSRRNATVRTLEGVRNAVLGREGAVQDGGSPMITGFVADIGRLPVAVADTLDGDPVLLPAELWENTNNIQQYELQFADGDGDVKMCVGWRGPYLRLPIGAEAARDGWGQLLTLESLDPVTDEIKEISGQVSPSSSETNTIDLDNLHTMPVSGCVYDTNLNDPTSANGQYLIVRIYGPEDGDLRTLGEHTTDLLSSPGSVIYDFTDISIGPRFIRAYQTENLPANPEEQINPYTLRSTIRRVMVGAEDGPTLVVR